MYWTEQLEMRVFPHVKLRCCLTPKMNCRRILFKSLTMLIIFTFRQFDISKIWGSHTSPFQYSSLLYCYAMLEVNSKVNGHFESWCLRLQGVGSLASKGCDASSLGSSSLALAAINMYHKTIRIFYTASYANVWDNHTLINWFLTT